MIFRRQQRLRDRSQADDVRKVLAGDLLLEDRFVRGDLPGQNLESTLDPDVAIRRRIVGGEDLNCRTGPEETPVSLGVVVRIEVLAPSVPFTDRDLAMIEQVFDVQGRLDRTTGQIDNIALA